MLRFKRFYLLPKARQILLGFVFSGPLGSAGFCPLLAFAQSGQSGRGILLIAGLENIPRRTFAKSNTAYAFSSQVFHFGVQVPVWQKAFVAEAPRGQQITVSNVSQLSHSVISPLGYSVHQLQSRLGVSYTSVGHKNTFQAALSVTTFISVRDVQPVQFRPTALFLFRRQVTSKWSYRLGLAYSFVFGSGLPLPVVGSSVRVSSRSRIDAILPFSIRYTVRHSHHFASMVSFKPNGSVSMADPIGNGASQPTLFLRNRAFLLEYRAEVRTGHRLRLFVALGYLFRRQVWISEGTGGFNNPATYFSGQVKPGWTLQAGFRMRLGRQKETPAIPGNTAPISLSDSPSTGSGLSDEHLRQMDVDELIDNPY